MKLYFVRHGEAEELAPTDHGRELTDNGKERVAISALVLKRLGITPELIYSSPRIRAKQTAEIIADALNMAVTITEEVNFGFDLTNIATLIQNLKPNDEVMFVGHNPDMSQVIHKMTGASVSMKKGGLARIDIVSRKAQRGELVWMIAPKVFDALHDQPESADLQKWLSTSEPLEIESSLDDMGESDNNGASSE